MIRDARTPLAIASAASEGPTSNCSTTFSGRSRGLFRTLARLIASRSVKLPVISAEALSISSLTVGAE